MRSAYAVSPPTCRGVALHPQHDPRRDRRGILRRRNFPIVGPEASLEAITMGRFNGTLSQPLFGGW